MRPALRPIAAGLLIGAAACGGAPVSSRPDAAAVADAAPLADAAPACPATASANVVIGGRTLGYAGAGNVDLGNESSCGGPPEGVAIVLSVDASRTDPASIAELTLTLPVTTGPRTVTGVAGAGHTSWSATLDVTQVTVDGAGPGLAAIAGTFSGDVTGAFVATHCASLDVVCI